MEWTFLNSAQPSTTAAALLAEWEQRTQPAPSAAYTLARTEFLAQFQLLSRLLLPTAPVNVDEEDIRNLLQRARSLRIGSGRAEGAERAARAAQLAIEHTQQHLLGPLPAGLPVTAFLYAASHPAAELALEELTTITEGIQHVFGRNLEVVFGYDTNGALARQLEVCLLLGYGPLPTSAPVVVPRPTIPPEEIFPAAVCLVTAYQKVSSSLLQRHLGTGYNRTCQLLEELEAAGIIWRDKGGYGVVR